MPDTTRPVKPVRVVNRLDAIFRRTDENRAELRRLAGPAV